MPKKTNAIDFEKSLKALESLVHKMETKDLSLEQSLSAFEQGVTLCKECYGALNSAEERVAQLVSDDLNSICELEERSE